MTYNVFGRTLHLAPSIRGKSWRIYWTGHIYLPPPGQCCETVCLNSFGHRTSPSDNSNDRLKYLCLVNWATALCVWTLRALTRNLLTYLLTFLRTYLLTRESPGGGGLILDNAEAIAVTRLTLFLSHRSWFTVSTLTTTVLSSDNAWLVRSVQPVCQCVIYADRCDVLEIVGRVRLCNETVDHIVGAVSSGFRKISTSLVNLQDGRNFFPRYILQLFGFYVL